MTECPGQTGFATLRPVGSRRSFSDFLLPQCCPATSPDPSNGPSDPRVDRV
jgi:hypothetical protein